PARVPFSKFLRLPRGLFLLLALHFRPSRHRRFFLARLSDPAVQHSDLLFHRGGGRLESQKRPGNLDRPRCKVCVHILSLRIVKPRPQARAGPPRTRHRNKKIFLAPFGPRLWRAGSPDSARRQLALLNLLLESRLHSKTGGACSRQLPPHLLHSICSLNFNSE